jgi:hypothetical protein
VAIDKFVKEVCEKDLRATMIRKYRNEIDCYPSNFFGAHYLRDPDKHEPDRIQQLRPLLLELCNSISPSTPTLSGGAKKTLQDGVVDQIVRQHLKEIGDRFSEDRLMHREKDWKPEPANQKLLDVPKPVTTLSAINDWSSAPAVPPSLQSLSEKVLMNDLRQSLVGAKATAAFCCGGSIGFREIASDGHASCHAEVAPVTVRWEDQHTEHGKVVFSQASSGDPTFRRALEQLCVASEPASFGRGGENVFDGK